MRAIQEMIRVLRPVNRGSASDEGLGWGTGRILIFVWAYEQRGGGRRKFDTVFGENEKAQDVLVPWVMTPQHTPTMDHEEVHHRCTLHADADYHLFRQGELEQLVEWAVDDLQENATSPKAVARLAVPQIASGWDKGNWWGVWRVEYA